jgi:squalene-hopene/tetraprenyl-beta-curcumene cyclase
MTTEERFEKIEAGIRDLIVVSRRLTVILVLFSSAAFGQNWSPKRAADYLDSRQEKWFVWPTAASADGPCVSCHTGLTYLLARPALRSALSETQPTKYEAGLMDRLRSKVGNKPAAALRDVEVIFTALFLANQDRGKASLGADAQRAFEQLWSLQSTEGQSKGGWRWYNADLDPWETPDSPYFGSALAALAIGSAPLEYQNRPDIKERISSLRDYFESAYQGQPLHNRLALLWASSRLPAVFPISKRDPLIQETFAAQEKDGGWTLQALGSWRPHKDAPVDAGSNNFATGFVVYTLRQAGVPTSDPRIRRAVAWLGSRQESDSGAWKAVSMNKHRPPESMEASFMQDAATAFATLALLEGK